MALRIPRPACGFLAAGHEAGLAATVLAAAFSPPASLQRAGGGVWQALMGNVRLAERRLTLLLDSLAALRLIRVYGVAGPDGPRPALAAACAAV